MTLNLDGCRLATLTERKLNESLHGLGGGGFKVFVEYLNGATLSALMPAELDF